MKQWEKQQFLREEKIGGKIRKKLSLASSQLKMGMNYSRGTESVVGNGTWQRFTTLLRTPGRSSFVRFHPVWCKPKELKYPGSQAIITM